MSFILDILPYLEQYFEIDLWGVNVDRHSELATIKMGDRAYPFYSLGLVKVHSKKVLPNIVRVITSSAAKLRDIYSRAYEILYFHGIPLELSFLITNNHNTLIVSHIHGLHNPFSASRNRLANSWIGTALYEKYRKSVVSKSDLTFIAADSPSFIKFSSSFPLKVRAKTIRLFNFANPELFHPIDKDKCRRRHRIRPDEKVLIYTGRLCHWKDPLLLIRVLHQVRLSNPNVCLVIIGDGELMRELEKLAKQLDLIESIKLLGQIPRQDLPQWLNAADVFLFTSKGEGIPMSLAEALMCGLPIVTVDCTGVQDLVINGQTGFRVMSRKPDEIAKKVITALDWAQEMKKNCIKKSIEFTPQRAAQIISERILAL